MSVIAAASFASWNRSMRTRRRSRKTAIRGLSDSDQRAVLQTRACGRAELIYPKCCFFLRRFPGDTEQIAQTDDKGGRASRSVWSAWSLLPLSDVWRGSKAGASSTHSIRFARFGSGYAYAGLGTDAPYPEATGRL